VEDGMAGPIATKRAREASYRGAVSASLKECGVTASGTTVRGHNKENHVSRCGYFGSNGCNV
jgi:hypothetical protein